MRRLAIFLLLTAAATAAASGASTHRVVQKAKAFDQAEMTVKAGDKLEIVNEDDVVHNLFSMSPGYRFNEAQKPGETDTLELPTAGDVEIRCAIHPTMKMVVHVE